MMNLRPHSPSLRSSWISGFLLALVAFLPFGSVARGQTGAAYRISSSPAVGVAVTAQVTVPVGASGTVATVKVVSNGVVGADFTPATVSGDTCGAGASVTSGGSCTFTVQFKPTGVGARRGAVVLADGSGVVLGSKELFGRGVGPLAVMIPAKIDTVAGNGTWLYRSLYENEPATSSPLFLPAGVAVDAQGNVFISDSSNNRIRRVDGTTKLIVTIAGDGNPGFARDGFPATVAQISNPAGLVLNGAGDLYIADSGNHAVRKLEAATGKLVTVAGQLGTPGFSGDGQAANLSTLNSPESVALDADGNLYIADMGNDVIRRIDAATGKISTFAGKPGIAGYAGDGGAATDANLNMPWGVATDEQGNLYIADLGNSMIRKVTGTTISTIAGTGHAEYDPTLGLLGTQTNLKDPAAVMVDPAGNVYIADSGHNRVVKMDGVTKRISLAAGAATHLDVEDNAPATLSGIYGPYALAPDAQGNVYIADIFHHRIRILENSLSSFKMDPIRVGRTSAAQLQTIENDGTADLHWTAISPDVNTTFDAGQTTCSVGTMVAMHGTCVLAAQFMPQVTGTDVHGFLSILSDAVNSPNIVDMHGEVDALEPTKTVLTTTPNPSALGAIVTMQATVSGDAGPAGVVKFYDGAALLGQAQTNASGVASFSVSSLPLGSHVLTAAFAGDAKSSPSTSLPVTQVVKQNPAVTLASSLNPSKVGEGVTLTATVAATPNVPTGNVAFKEGATLLGTVAVNGSGVASLTLSTLSAGSHSIVAQYVGDVNNLAANSTALAQQVDRWGSTTTVSSSSNPSDLGTAVTLQAQVTSMGTDAATGDVTFKDGTAVVATVSLNPQGVASYTVSNLTVGTHSITASYVGDGATSASVSSSLGQVVQKIGTTTTLASSLNPANGGATVRLTATVTASSTNSIAGTLTGAVMFSEGTTTLGSGALNASGIATLDLSTLPVGTHNVVATYVGNNGYAASSSASLAQVVQLATTAVQLTSSAPTSTAGNNVVLTAVVTGDGGVPTGTVTFMDGTQAIGTGTLNGSGQASITVNSLTAGSHTITVQYSGDTKSKPATSAPLTQVIQQATTSVTLASGTNPAISGTTISFAAAVSSSGSMPTGTLKLMEGSTVLSTGTISATGTVQFSLSGLAAGTHSVVAVFAGDADHAGSQSAAIAQVVKLGDTAVTVASSANPSLSGASVTFTAKVTGNGPQVTGSVVFQDGAAVLGNGVLNAAGVATFTTTALTLGSHNISANYAGDVNHNASVPATVTQVVKQSTTTAVASNLNPSLVGDAITFTATVVGGSGQPVNGSVEFFDGGTNLGTAVMAGGSASLKVSTLQAGSHIITAKYLGDSASQESTSATLAQGVNTADTTVTLVSNANPATVGTAIVFTATVESKGKAPTGTVSFVEGSTVLATAPIVNGVASASVNSLKAGQHAIVARYNGDSGTQDSNSAVLLETVQQPTTTVVVSSVNPALTAQGMTLTATVTGSSPTGTITFKDGATVLGTTALVNGTASIQIAQLSGGTHTITASYGGDNFNLASASAELTEVVMMRPSTTSMTASSQSYKTGEQVTLVAVVKTNGPVAPTGTVTFTVNGKSLGDAAVTSSGAATLVISATAARYDIVAQYNGDAVYMPSTASTYTIQLGDSTTFTLTTDPPSLTMKSGDHATVNLAVSSSTSFSDTVSFGCLDLPEEATCTFSKTSVKVSNGAPATASVEVDTGLPLGAGPRAPVASAIVWPVAFAMGLIVMLRRRTLGAKLAGLVAMLMLLVAGAGLTGCGNSINVKSTPAGTYNVRIIATGQGTGVSQVANVQVTVQ